MTHDQIREMVRRVNPIPDPSIFESVDVPVLRTPLERRMEMQTDRREVTNGRGQNRWRGPLVGIAVAAAIVVGGLVVVLTNDDPPVATPAPNATRINPEEMDSPLAPGAYFVDPDGDETSSLGGTFVIEGTGWTALPSGTRKEFGEDYVSLMVVEVDQVWSPACVEPAALAAGATAADLANQVAANGFAIQEALAPVSAFGHDGHHLVVEVPAGCAGDSFMVWDGPTFGRFYQSPGQVVEYWFLDVEGIPVMVEASWFPVSPEEDVAELRAVTDTLVLTP
jgi:hypothetical protein